MESEKLLQILIEQTRQNSNQVEQLKNYDLATLTWKDQPDSWNVLECLEHLNLYGAFYLPQIEHKIKNATSQGEPEFNSSFLGDYFAKSMLPKSKMVKMKTFKSKNPIRAQLDKKVIDIFLTQQLQLIDLLNKSRNVSLNKVKITTTFPLLTLKLGDTFRFLINHNIRHLHQVDGVLSKMKINKR
ncbi:DinB family protein [Flavobacterium sp. UBA6135]|uniref:DinB family protein n=1 Tax=Flavobacterium sp. UBA6135 TaxID=1946553 RepID=UPI0025BF1470|nr:DinB family protein [Flavobacterium sp. UBA6135]